MMQTTLEATCYYSVSRPSGYGYSFVCWYSFGPVWAFACVDGKGNTGCTVVGGLAGGTVNTIMGGSFFEGFEDGAFSGAISGAITGGLGSWASSAGKLTGLTKALVLLSKAAATGAVSEVGASLLGDIGDNYWKDESLSFKDILSNATFSGILGAAFAGTGHGLANKWPVLIKGLTKGNGSWAHVWATQTTRSIKHKTKLSLKTILKGLRSTSIKDTWDNMLEPAKNIADKKIKPLWDLLQRCF